MAKSLTVYNGLMVLYIYHDITQPYPLLYTTNFCSDPWEGDYLRYQIGMIAYFKAKLVLYAFYSNL